MTRTTKILLAAVFAAAVAGGVGVAAAGGPGDPAVDDEPGNPAVDDEPALTGTDLERAGAAALEASRAFGDGGTVTSAEGPDEDATYEVHVTLSDGNEVDVDLDQSFAVVGTPEVEGQDDAPGEPDDSNEPDDSSASDDD